VPAHKHKLTRQQVVRDSWGDKVSPAFLIKGDLCVELKVTVLRTAANAHLTWLHVPHVKHNHHLQAGWVSSPSVPSAMPVHSVGGHTAWSRARHDMVRRIGREAYKEAFKHGFGALAGSGMNSRYGNICERLQFRNPVHSDHCRSRESHGRTYKWPQQQNAPYSPSSGNTMIWAPAALAFATASAYTARFWDESCVVRHGSTFRASTHYTWRKAYSLNDRICLGGGDRELRVAEHWRELEHRRSIVRRVVGCAKHLEALSACNRRRQHWLYGGGTARTRSLILIDIRSYQSCTHSK